MTKQIIILHRSWICIFVRHEGEFYHLVSEGFFAFISLWCMKYGPESVFVISKTKQGRWWVNGPGGKVAAIEPTSSESPNDNIVEKTSGCGM
mgnify:CR=1 FL=1